MITARKRCAPATHRGMTTAMARGGPEAAKSPAQSSRQRTTALMTALYEYSARLTVRRPATEAVRLPAPRRTV
jgi:hypothetical protein